MAFMQAPVSTGGGDMADRLPILSYNAKAGRLFVLDRTQAPDGIWETNKTDVTMTQPTFAVDFLSLEVGHMHFAAGQAPIFVMVPMGQPMPPKPASPGNDDKGKALQFRQGFRLKVIGREIGGARELAGNAGTFIEGMNDLHTEYEASPEAAKGKLPLVKMTNVVGVKAGQSENYKPVFKITGWVDRPAVLGTATVSPPSRGAPAAPAKAPPAAAKQIELAGGGTGGMPDFDDEIPFAAEWR
jgi:hypothetical protein